MQGGTHSRPPEKRPGAAAVRGRDAVTQVTGCEAHGARAQRGIPAVRRKKRAEPHADNRLERDKTTGPDIGSPPEAWRARRYFPRSSGPRPAEKVQTGERKPVAQAYPRGPSRTPAAAGRRPMASVQAQRRRRAPPHSWSASANPFAPCTLKVPADGSQALRILTLP